jgi:hypothetical protein
MTDNIDTAEIRADLDRRAPAIDREDRAHCRALCNALDAARAMRDTHAADVTDLANKHARALDRAEAAEARIAAALAWCDNDFDIPQVARIRRALTGDTE